MSYQTFMELAIAVRPTSASSSFFVQLTCGICRRRERRFGRSDVLENSKRPFCTICQMQQSPPRPSLPHHKPPKRENAVLNRSGVVLGLRSVVQIRCSAIVPTSFLLLLLSLLFCFVKRLKQVKMALSEDNKVRLKRQSPVRR